MDIYDQLKRDEGLRLKAYKDSLGIWTVGYGHNLEATGAAYPQEISLAQAESYLFQDVRKACDAIISNLPWVSKLSGPRYGCLINMCFNMGVGKLLKFKTTLGLIKQGDYTAASQEMLKSVWATQVGDRATRLSKQMATDQWV